MNLRPKEVDEMTIKEIMYWFSGLSWMNEEEKKYLSKNKK